MARAKKPIVKATEKIYYHATDSDNYLSNEIVLAESQEQAIAYLREDEGDVEHIFMYEIKCTGKYKVNFTLEKID